MFVCDPTGKFPCGNSGLLSPGKTRYAKVTPPDTINDLKGTRREEAYMPRFYIDQNEKMKKKKIKYNIYIYMSCLWEQLQSQSQVADVKYKGRPV